MKAILLAGGTGSRLYPVTLGVSKQLLPVFDKPMVYYPLSVLMMAGIREILLISTPIDIDNYKRLLGDGYFYGIKIKYKIQEKPNGIAEAFIIAEDFIGEDPIALILGDNIFYGIDFKEQLELVVERTIRRKLATIFGYSVKNPKRYGVIEFDNKGIPISIEEKPVKPKSNIAVVGLYFYPNEVVKVSKQISLSKRGELEITSLNQYFLSNGQLKVEKFQRGFTWLDTGTHKSLLEAGQFISTIEKRQGIKIGCLDEIAYDKGFIDKDRLINNVEKMKETTYGKYLIKRYSL
ncbi:MAG: glucose-1-phosphate thymidylyltransferase RfbA [Flavobacteriaceae bacterium]